MKFDLETQTIVLHGRADLKPLTLGLSAIKEAGQMLGTADTSLATRWVRSKTLTSGS